MEKIKKFEHFKLNEGLRFNSDYLSLDLGEYNIDEILAEAKKLVNTLESWKKLNVSTIETYHTKEIIPNWK